MGAQECGECDEDAGMGEHEFQCLAHNALGIERAAFVDAAVEIHANHHRHIEYQPHGT